MNRFAILFAATVPLCACAENADSTGEVRAPAVQVLGEAVNCIQTTRIRDTDVHDDYTIDFELVNGDVYRNTLPNRCPGLGFEDRFAYRTTTSQLCSVDTITVLYSGGSRGPSCGLGQFVPVRYVEEAD